MSFQKPLVIYPHLPKLVEAVVKSLDPNSTSNRDAVLDTATEILGHVVKTCAPLPPLTHRIYWLIPAPRGVFPQSTSTWQASAWPWARVRVRS
jgi:hypothetical protein